MSKKTTETVTMTISDQVIKTTVLTAGVKGDTPLILNRMAEKAWQELLMPSPKKNAAERASSQKHDPIAEFRSSVYRTRDEDAETAIHLPTGMFKKAIASAALDIPGAFKAQVGRLTSIATTTIDLYGVPELYTCIVRNSGINRSPDVRTRAMFRRWACILSVEYVQTLIPAPSLLNLIRAAGVFVGIGDNRVEKGAGSYGRFSVVPVDDPAFQAILQSGGRDAQLAALASPAYADEDTAEIIEWFINERERRTVDHSTPTGVKRKAKGAAVKGVNGDAGHGEAVQ